MSRLAIEKVQKRDHNIKKLREKYDVKSMVIEYEHVLSQVNGYVKNMGADQSAVRPIPNNNNNGLVKQRIEKFNQIQQDFKKQTRSVSTYDNSPKLLSTEFHRSKSVDSSKRQNKKKLAESSNGFDNKSLPRKPSRKQDKNPFTEELQRRKATSTVYLNNINVDNDETKTVQNEHPKADLQIQEHSKPEFSDNHFENGTIEKEFEIIENQMQDAANTILEMTENKSNSVFISTIENFVITNNKHNTNFLKDKFCHNDAENIHNVDIYLTEPSADDNHFEQMRQKNIECSEPVNKTNLLETHSYNNDGSIENLDIYLTDRTSIGENQFGEICKDNLKNLDFVEAYNQTGYELLMTTVHSVTELEDKELSSENKSDHFQEQDSDNDKTYLGIDNALYFSKEELETLIPDEDSEPVSGSAKLKKNEEDEFIEKLESAGAITVQKKFSDAIKSETTIYDSFQNPRIAKVRSITKREDFSKDNILKDDDDLSKNVESKPKLEYIVEEIIATERKYIDHLERVLEDYMPYFKSNNLAPKTTIRTVFGNIKDIYQLTQKLYRTLKNCPNYEAVAKTFLRYEPLFDMYPLYFKNKPSADQYLLGEFKDIVAIRERELNDQLGLASHLLTPIQRLGKYILFLEQITKELEKNGTISDFVPAALQMVKREMATGNDYIAVDSIKKSPVGLVQQGHFLMREKFKLIKPKKYEAVVFFFEKILVFTTVNPKNPELFIYKDSIRLDEMGITTYDDQPLNIHLKRFPSSNNKESDEQNRYLLEAKREKDKKLWSEEIEKRLWDQLIECRERQQLLRNCAKKKNVYESNTDQKQKKKAGRK